MGSKSLFKTYKTLCNDLQTVYSSSEAQSLARILVERISGVNAHSALADKNIMLTDKQMSQMQFYLSQLKLQKPIQYILGTTEFFGIEMKVNEKVLVPRPETEELVEYVIKSNKHHSPNILDIGTGSGCIAIALAKSIPASNVYAIDISNDAITLASENAQIADAKVVFFQLDVLDPPKQLKGSPFDVIVSNPPYVRESEKPMMRPNVIDYEPGLALFVTDSNPLVFYKAIAQLAKNHLNDQGLVFCEINEALAKETVEVFANYGFRNVAVEKDINGKDRFVVCQI
jgi:release factor glutamine methyltransferase